jgi:hypothetical protein
MLVNFILTANVWIYVIYEKKVYLTWAASSPTGSPGCDWDCIDFMNITSRKSDFTLELWLFKETFTSSSNCSVRAPKSR